MGFRRGLKALAVNAMVKVRHQQTRLSYKAELVYLVCNIVCSNENEAHVFVSQQSVVQGE